MNASTVARQQAQLVRRQPFVRVELSVLLLCSALSCTLPAAVTEEQLEEIWREEIFSGLEPLGRFPRLQVNETAKRLEQIGTSLGIDFSSAHRPEMALPAAEAAERFEAGKDLNAWLDNAFAVTGGPAPNLPTEMEDYLTWAGTGLGKAEELLLEAEPPSWQLDLSLRDEMPIPNLVAQLQLHRLLSLRALRLLEEGSFEAADRSLEAAWRLRQASGHNPVLISQLVAMAQTRFEQIVLRSLCAPGDRWQVRLREKDFEADVLRALQLEAWSGTEATRRVLVGAEGGFWISGGLTRFAAAGYGEAVQHGVERLRTLDPRTFDNERFFEEEYSRLPRWNIVARLMLPDLFESWLRAVRVGLETELTLAVLEVRAGAGLSVPSRIASTAMAGAFWRVEREGEDVRLLFQDRIPEASGRNLALDYAVSPADCAATIHAAPV